MPADFKERFNIDVHLHTEVIDINWANHVVSGSHGPCGKTSGITVNTIAPGLVPTDLSTPLLVASDGSATALQISMSEQTRAANRLGTVEDIADATLLLVSEKSRWITAQFISVSGGITGTM